MASALRPSRVIALTCLLAGLSLPHALAVAPNPPGEMTMMEMRETILERARALAEFPGQQIPEATAETIARADRIAGGAVFFYGREPIEVGLHDIDWSGGQRRHQEWPAQLNRFFHLAPLASAYRSTHDERYARAARAYIEDWIRSDPRDPDRCRPGDNTLNVSIRLGTSTSAGWSGLLPVFLDSPSFDDAFLRTMFDSISTQAEFLSHHLTEEGNWRISQLDALVFTALRLPFLKNAPELLQAGISGMHCALATQFLPDGVHIERSPGYHEWMAGVGVNYAVLARLFPEADARVDAARIARALDYGVQSALSGINDSSGNHADADSERAERWRVRMLQRLFPDEEPSPHPPKEQAFPDAGQVFLRSAWKPGADYLAFDASTWGGGHGHLSRLSFTLRSGGRALVADPGILSYEMSDPLGPYGKSTPAHSTLNLNGGNQSEADARLLDTAFTPATALIHAEYQGGYWPEPYGWSFEQGHGAGVFGLHDRVLFWVRGEYLLALDTMKGDDGAAVHNVWQLGPMDAWSKDEKTLSWWSQNDDANLFLQLLPLGEEVEMQCFEGSERPLRGWVGWHGYDARPAPEVEFRYPAGGWNGRTTAVLLVPFTGLQKPVYTVKQSATVGGARYALVLERPDGNTDLIAWSKDLALPLEGMPWDVTTDGAFLWLRRESGEITDGFVLRGSAVTQHGAALESVASVASTR